ncbi:ATP-binding cassette domain-containing protein [Robbsia sp. KACC 23696]|uniref:ATP-binding cassette domain-containing protein n=1 Tax=Robbsia sp. KACC 23696 TaxID=3149231 RepID=UPI00325A4B99
MLTVETLSLSVGGRASRSPRTLLDAIDLEVRPGEMLMVMGENGSGKSTLLACLAGQKNGLTAASGAWRQLGAVCLDGVPVLQMAPMALARRRAWMRQSTSISFGFTADEVVELGRFGQGTHARNRTIALDALALSGASDLVGRDVMTLSGGELARVQFARALAQLWPDLPGAHALHDGADARVASGTEAVPPLVEGIAESRYLLLDEPTAAMDLRHQQHVLGAARRLTREWGMGVVAVVHDPNLALAYADRVVMLKAGHVLADVGIDALDAALLQRCFDVPVSFVDGPSGRRALIA